MRRPTGSTRSSSTSSCARRASRLPVFYAVVDDVVVLCLEATTLSAADAFAAEFEASAGASSPAGYDELRRAWQQAEIALGEARRPDAAGSVVRFDALSRRGMLAFVTGEDARELGSAILKPLLDHDAAQGSALLASVRIWLTHNGQFESAARELGVHRHTLRARVAQSEQLLERDLGSFQVRAEVWAALLATGDVAPLEHHQGIGTALLLHSTTTQCMFRRSCTASQLSAERSRQSPSGSSEVTDARAIESYLDNQSSER